MTLHEILIITVYEVNILVAIVLVVKLFKHVYGLCNFTSLQMPDNFFKQNCWEIIAISS